MENTSKINSPKVRLPMVAAARASVRAAVTSADIQPMKE
jgi:hypothetical protein